MPCLSITYNPKVGPLIQVMIWKVGATPASGSPTQPSSATTYQALIDSGASCSCVSDKVIKAEGLVPSGKQPVGGVHGNQATNAYQFILGIPFVQSQHVGGAIAANVIGFPINGVEFVPMPGFDVLLGRDVICRGSLTMTFDGHATLCL